MPREFGDTRKFGDNVEGMVDIRFLSSMTVFVSDKR